jgi:molybdopterin/thiamine biosynthesis adenylyltransferase
MTIMTDDELLHYARQLLLSDVDVDGQQKLKKSHVVVLGLGGLGSPVALYLAAAGVGRLTLVDGDRVDPTNLHRQIIHSRDYLGCLKVESAHQRIAGLNPFIQVDTVPEYANVKNMSFLDESVDCIADCTDRFSTRFMANRMALDTGTPLVSAAALGIEGQITTIDPRDSNAPCYACLIPDIPEVERTCAENGVLGPVVGMIGTLQAVEVIGILLGWPDRLTGRLLRFHAKQMSWKSFFYRKDPSCVECGSAREFI